MYAVPAQPDPDKPDPQNTGPEQALSVPSAGHSAVPLPSVSRFERFAQMLYETALTPNPIRAENLLAQIRAIPEIGSQQLKTLITSLHPQSGKPLLHELIANGATTQTLRLALEMGADITTRSTLTRSDGVQIADCNALHVALFHGHNKLASELINAGCAVNDKNSLGETPLITHLKYVHVTSEPDVVRTLLKNGASVEIRDGQRDLPVTYAMQHHRWNIIPLLVSEHRRNLADGKWVEPSPEELRSYAVWSVTQGADFGTFMSLAKLSAKDGLNVSHNSGPLLPLYENVLHELVRTSMSVPMRSCLPFALKSLLAEEARRELGEETIKALIRAVEPSSGYTAMQILCSESPYTGLIEELARLGSDVTAPTPKGMTPLMLYLSTSSILDPQVIELFARHGDNLQGLTPRGETLIDLALQAGSINCVLALATHGAALPARLAGKDFTFHTRHGEETYSLSSLASKILDLQEQANFGVREEARELLRTTGNLEHVYRYLAGFIETEEQQDIDPTHLTTLLPHLLFTYKSGAITQLVDAIESMMDAHESKRGYHPNEVELMALLDHPKNEELLPSDLNHLTTAITSINRFIDVGAPVRTGAVRTWGRIGALSFSFQKWRFDAEQGVNKSADGSRSEPAPSLFEQYGFKRVPRRTTDNYYDPGQKKFVDLFGTGYELHGGSKTISETRADRRGNHYEFKLDLRTHIEFRRAYIAVYHPDHGTLVIRNSSPSFGRSSMPHPAYWQPPDTLQSWLPKFVSAFLPHRGIDHVRNLTPESLEREYLEVLDPLIYLQHTTNVPHLAFLVDQIQLVTKDYAAWKFNSDVATAWKTDAANNDQLVGGYLSPGFRSVLAYLERREQEIAHARLNGEKGRSLPELAFVNPKFPPWSPYQFLAPGNVPQSRMRVTDDVLRVLKKLVSGTATKQELAQTGLRSFLQSGLDNQAELVLLAAEREN